MSSRFDSQAAGWFVNFQKIFIAIHFDIFSGGFDSQAAGWFVNFLKFFIAIHFDIFSGGFDSQAAWTLHLRPLRPQQPTHVARLGTSKVFFRSKILKNLLES